jgi:DNA-binding response OmpR family regulator
LSGPRVLVIEDDPDIWRSLEIILGRAGYLPTWAADGLQGLRQFADEAPDIVVLDLGLPRLDGWTVLDRLRRLSDVPVLVLTARGLEQEKVRGLLAGADDYLTKPYGNDELVARVGMLLRRKPPQSHDGGVYDDGVYDDGRVRVGFGQGEVTVGGRQVELTATEFRLLAALVRHPGQVLSHDQLLDLVWREPAGAGHGRIKFAVLGVRRKCGWRGDGSPIESARGFGYRYVPPQAGKDADPRP